MMDLFAALAARTIGIASINTFGHHRDGDIGTQPVDPDQDWQKMFQNFVDKLSPLGLAVIAATFFSGIIAIGLVRYCLYGVVATLAMVENPQSANSMPEPEERYTDEDMPPDFANENERVIILHEPITSKISTTLRHLQSRGGWLARFRGFSASLAYGFVYSMVTNLLTPLLQPLEFHRKFVNIPVAEILVSILASLFVSGLGMTWTWIVISEPSPLYWFQRSVNSTSWRKILAPTFYTACAWQLGTTLPMLLTQILVLTSPDDVNNENMGPTLLKLLGIAGIALVCVVFICLPAEVALRRVQASMLPAQHDAIVPFDRTFGGLVVPEHMGGSGKLEYADALKSFDSPTRLRLVKLYAKSFGIEVALWVIFVIVLSVEVTAFGGAKA